MKLDMVDGIRQIKSAVREHPYLSIWFGAAITLLSLVDLTYGLSFPGNPLGQSASLLMDVVADFVAINLVLYVAYRWSPALGLAAAFLSLAAHIPDFLLKSTSAPHTGALIISSGTALLGIYLIARLRRVEQEARASHQIFQTMSEASPIGVYLVQDGRFCYVNPHFQEFTGYSAPELLGTASLAIVAADHREIVRQKAIKMLKGQRSTAYEYPFVTKNGETRWCLETVASIRLHDRPATAGNFMDITERKEAEAEIELRNKQLTALQRVSQALAQSVDLETVSSQALKAAFEVLHLDASSLRIIDDSTQELVPLATKSLVPQVTEEVIAKPRIPVGQGYAGKVAQSGQPIVIDDLGACDQSFYGVSSKVGFKSFVGVPLRTGDKLIGVIAGFTLDRCSFTKEDTDLLANLGNMVGMAVAKAQLFEKEKRRAEELAALQQVSQAVSGSLELREVARVALEATLAVMDLDGGSIAFVDKANQELVLLSLHGLPPELARDALTLPKIKIGQGLSGRAVQAGEPLVVADLAEDGRRFYGPSHTSKFRSGAYVPLKVKGEVVGVINGLSRRRRTFGLGDLELMASLGNMVGMAIANARLFEEQRHRAEELMALQEVSQAVSGSLDLETVANVALEAILSVMRVDGGTIRYIDDATQELVLVAHRGMLPEHISHIQSMPNMKVGQGLTGKTAQSGEPLVVEDLFHTEGRFYGRQFTGDYRSVIYVPLKVRGKVVGVVGGLSLRQRAFGSDEVRLMAALGNMVAIALANASIFSQQRRRADELAALQQVSQAVSGSLDLETVANVALEAILGIMQLGAGAIRYVDEATQELVLIGHRGMDPEQADYMKVRPNIKIGQGLAGKAAQSGELLVVEDLLNQEGRFYGRQHTAGFRSAVWLPLKVRGTVVGVLGGFSMRQRIYEQTDMMLMASLGNMVGMAIANARIFAQQKRRAEELVTLRQVSQAVSGSLELKDVATIGLDAFVKLSGMDGASVKYVDEATQEFVLLVHRGMPDELSREVEARPRVKIYEGLLGLAAQKGKPLVVQDANLPEAVYKSAFRSGIQSHVSLLLRVKDRLVGVISGVSRVKRNFTPPEAELLTSLGNMIAIAVANALLFKQVEVAATQWRSTFDAMSDGVSIHSADFRILRANKALASILNTTPPALVGRPCYEVCYSSGKLAAQCPLLHAKTEGRPAASVSRDVKLGNRWLHIRCDPALDSESRLANVVHSVRDTTEMRSHHENLERLHRLSQSLATSLNIDTVLELSLKQIANVLGDADADVGVALLDDSGKKAKIVAARGVHCGNIEGTEIPLSIVPDKAVQRLFGEHQPWVVANSSLVRLPGRSQVGLQPGQSFAVLPLISGNRNLGGLFILRADGRVFAAQEIDLLSTYTTEVALAVENARLFTQTETALRRRIAEMQALFELLTTATQRPDPDIVLKNAVEQAAQILHVDRAGVSTLGEPGKRWVARAIYPEGVGTLADPDTIADIPGFPLARQVLQEGIPLIVEDTENLHESKERDLTGRLGIRSCLVLPLTLGGRILGFVQFSTVDTPKAYSTEEVELGKAVAAYIASLIHDAEQHGHIEKERNTLEAIITSMAEGLVMVDTLDRVAYCNPAAREILDIRTEDLVGLPVETFEGMFMGRVVDHKKFLGPRPGGTSTESPRKEFELFFRGGKRIVEATVFTIGSAESPAGTGVLLRDITSEREVDRMKTEFISIASHELRTPMTVVMGFAELLLKNRSIKKEPRTWLQYIHRESERLSSIVDDLLNISRIEMGRLSVKQDVVSLKSVVAQLMGRLRSNYRSHSFCCEVPDDLPNLWTDAEKLAQILYNLMDNGAKYSPHGGKIAVSARRDEKNVEAIISVSDQGIGIPEEEIPHLFTRFHRIRSPETDGIRGNGLGLYIVKSLVEMMGGRVWTESRLHEGSTFYLTIPLERSVVKEGAISSRGL